jgi:hypothetical protein
MTACQRPEQRMTSTSMPPHGLLSPLTRSQGLRCVATDGSLRLLPERQTVTQCV